MSDQIVLTAAQWIGNLLIQELQLLQDVKNQVESLQTDLQLIHHYLQGADAQTDTTEIPILVNQLRKIANDAEDTIDTYILKVQPTGGGGQPGDGISRISRPAQALYGLHSTHKVGKNIQDIQKKLKQVTTKLERHAMRRVADGREGSSRRSNDGRKKQRSYSHDDDNEGGSKTW